MKIKARDIIPGWPRSRSTMSTCDEWNWGFKYLRFWNRYRDWTDADLQRGVVEQAADADYHARQAAMVDSFRRIDMSKIDLGGNDPMGLNTVIYGVYILKSPAGEKEKK